jgi:hypothetical protein
MHSFEELVWMGTVRMKGLGGKDVRITGARSETSGVTHLAGCCVLLLAKWEGVVLWLLIELVVVQSK